MTSVPAEARPAVRVRGASLAFGNRTLWSGLDLDVEPGEFLAILGPNGSGKSSLLKVLLGQQSLPEGTVEIAGRRPGGQNRRIGYIPQQRALDEALTMRGVDLVGLGLDGHRWGTGLRGLSERRRLVARAIESVGAEAYAKQPVGRLSGGEQQRLRVAQSLVGDPEVLLCDEPLLSLDLAHQRAVSELIDERRGSANTAVLFVTHEINPILSYVDRMLYLVNGQFRVGKPDEVMNSETLSELYGTRIEVLKVGGQIHVAGAQSSLCEDEPHHFDEQAS
ncbi:metal ABC transporter ATP-binding protein [Amycolatopsis sp. lyj-112]|uniref:metal ABC transporter ATP-binding protein n=1 Tax=Amycolatopsis sp. lyj-112 TaxID=2789288 RepID=UPI00397B16F2